MPRSLMALPFALRSRIRLREEPVRARAAGLPPMALPVLAYWAVMGLLIYGVSSGALGPQLIAPAHLPASFERAPFLSRPAVASHPPEPPRAAAASRMAFTQPTVASGREDAPVNPIAHRDEREERHADPVAHRDEREERHAHPAARRDGHEDVAEDAPRRQRQPEEHLGIRAISRDDGEDTGPVPTCESVAAAAGDLVDLTAARGVPDLSRDAYAALLENGAYLSPCAIPASTALEICAAVKQGRALGVTVVTRPSDPRVGACVRRVVASMKFPSNPRLDVTRTHFDALRR